MRVLRTGVTRPVMESTSPVSLLTVAESSPTTTLRAMSTLRVATTDRANLTTGAVMERMRPRQPWSSAPMTARMSDF